MDSVRAAPLRGGFEHLVQPGHRAEIVREGLVKQRREPSGREAARRSIQSPAGAVLRGLRPDPAPPPWTRSFGRGTVDDMTQLRLVTV